MQRGYKKDSSTMEKITEMLQSLDLGQKEIKKDMSEMLTMKDDIKKEIAGLREDLKNVKDFADDNRKRVEELERDVKGTKGGQKSLEIGVLNLQMEKSLHVLRFQNVPEEEGEQLKDKMTKMLAEYLGKDQDWVGWDIDQVYRVNSQYAKTHNVPREIHVKLVKMETRDEVLRTQRSRPLTHGGREVLILKQIPRKIRETRKKYFF